MLKTNQKWTQNAQNGLINNTRVRGASRRGHPVCLPAVLGGLPFIFEDFFKEFSRQLFTLTVVRFHSSFAGKTMLYQETATDHKTQKRNNKAVPSAQQEDLLARSG